MLKIEYGTSKDGEPKAWVVDKDNARCTTVWAPTHKDCEDALRRHERLGGRLK